MTDSRKPKTGRLYIVATPIGHNKDITLRAIEVLNAVQAVVCEETREGSTLLKRLGIADKELVTLNEHNEIEKVPDLTIRMSKGQDLALISDCGTPVFADPGADLIQQASESGIPIIPIPGPSSLMAALSILDFKVEQFLFAGFISRKTEERQRQLLRYKDMHMPVILMDAPYRLAALLEEAAHTFGANRTITLACNLTLPNEHIWRGTIAEIQKRIGKQKAEFILIVH
ncbi:MAG: 16S rRNA (cytidine(1402)-2'-O)-methyltransferase [Anaerolineaceae bacterium]|jgi:16S rRNA (cytidine1402-2'-O)-methyltransferase